MGRSYSRGGTSRWSGASGGVVGGTQALEGVGDVPQRLTILQKTPPQEDVPQTRGLGGTTPNNALQRGTTTPDAPPRGPFQGPSAALTPEEVALLASNQVTYQNGRWVHTELARVSHDS